MSGGEQEKTTTTTESKEADNVNKDRDEDRLIRNTVLVFISPIIYHFNFTDFSLRFGLQRNVSCGL